MKTSILAMKCAKLYWPTSTTKLTLFHSIRSAQVLSAAHNSADKWTNLEVMTKLRAEAKQQGLWNLFLPKVSNLSNLEYAELAEMMGNSLLGSECFNCQAPDTGNMEVLHMFGTDKQKDRFLTPLLEGTTKSCFGMTEPAVASSDATNMQATIEIDEATDELVLNGTKWWTSGAAHPKLDLCIFMGLDVHKDVNVKVPRHKQHSMVSGVERSGVEWSGAEQSAKPLPRRYAHTHPQQTH